jgi:SAM-dependent methyltransferase
MAVTAPLRRLARRALEATGLIGPYYRFRERRLARAAVAKHEDGRPMPPAGLRVLVSGADARWFSETGQADAAKFRGLAADAGLDPARPLAVLDWGCGCGRIARWLAPEVAATGGDFLGCDLNPKLVAWCRANLPGRYFANRPQPPLDLDDAAVDLVYAHSVLTHLAEDTARAWLAELARVLKAGGLAILTFHDEAYAVAWGPPQVRTELGTRPYVVWNNALEGSNYLSAWTTRAHLAALADAHFEAVRMLPGGATAAEQAVAVLRRR